MPTLDFSVFAHGQGLENAFQSIFNIFHQQERIQIKYAIYDWNDAWEKTLNYGLKQVGPDISEIGSTWVGDLARMNVLRSFTTAEIASIMGSGPIFESLWLKNHQDTLYNALPWSGDVRVVFYRRDLLAKAGLDETTAFKDAASFEETMQALINDGFKGPLILPTVQSRMALHAMASWVWGAGGDFVSADGSQILFDKPEALNGIKSFFRLTRFFDQDTNNPSYSAGNDFATGKVAVIFSGSWLLSSKKFTPHVRENLGVARIPGIPFVGGSHLGIWSYTRQPENAFKFLRFLQNSPSLYPHIGLPIRQAAWEEAPFNAWPYPVFKQSLEIGRTFSTEKLWGMVEKRIIDTMGQIWNELLQNKANSDEIAEQAFIGLARRLRITLEDY